MANAIAQEEGFNTPGTIAQRNNNPGNLRSWPGAGSSSGYAQFSTLAAGWAALYSQIQTNINRGLTMNEFFAGKPGVYAGYSPSADGNQPAAYAAFVAGQIGVDVNIPLNSLDPTTFSASSAPPSSTTSSIALTPTSSLLCADGSPALADGTCDDSSTPTTEVYTASVVSTNWTAIGIGIAALVLWLWFRD